MGESKNPFQELYYTEALKAEAFVELFSDSLVKHTMPLFKPGNVVLKGLPGTGKTMMLSLLKPSIRIAYHEANAKFPVPAPFDKFIGAGINLVRTGVSYFGQRPITDLHDDNSTNALAIYFGDFLNYYIVWDILRSIDVLWNHLHRIAGIDLSDEKTKNFINKIKRRDCWFGYLSDVVDWGGLRSKVKERFITYNSYAQYNIDEIPEEIKNSKTNIGQPIIEVVRELKACGILEEDTEVFVRIDQFEELTWLDKSLPGLGSIYQSVVFKLLALRDSNVSYRIGTRPNEWESGNRTIFGTSATLEPLRNYKAISIDAVLRRPENRKTWTFPAFAEDIFYRRLKHAKLISDKRSTKERSLIRSVFGPGMSPQQKALKYVPKISQRHKAIVLDDSWPKQWCDFLVTLAKVDPLSARFAEAWARQKGKEKIVHQIPLPKPFPWEVKKYWTKERVDQALMQIASRNQQQLFWEGYNDILQLSGGNILVFLSLCQHIWEIWLRDSKSKEKTKLPTFDFSIQSLGIINCSSLWFDRITSAKDGGKRQLFIEFLGSMFYKELSKDIRMSYPGYNGFSIVNEDLKTNPIIDAFLSEAVDYGDIESRPHTSKLSDKRKRTKFYLSAILSPYFKIPASHQKEPIYASIVNLQEWLIKAKVFEERDLTSKATAKSKAKNQPDKNPAQLKIRFGK